jgi:hypothetical protein
LVNAKDVAEVLRNAMRINVHCAGITAEASANPCVQGGGMALIHGCVNLSNILMMGRWHNNVMMQYLHVQTQPILGNCATHMFNK